MDIKCIKDYLRKECLRLRMEQIRNERLCIYGGYALAALLILGAIVLGVYDQVDLAYSLFTGSVLPATVAVVMQNNR